MHQAWHIHSHYRVTVSPSQLLGREFRTLTVTKPAQVSSVFPDDSAVSGRSAIRQGFAMYKRPDWRPNSSVAGANTVQASKFEKPISSKVRTALPTKENVGEKTRPLATMIACFSHKTLPTSRPLTLKPGFLCNDMA